jgi:hypothetical protein
MTPRDTVPCELTSRMRLHHPCSNLILSTIFYFMLDQAHAVAANWLTPIPEPNRVSSRGIDEAVFSTSTQHGVSRGEGRGSGHGGGRSGYTYKDRGGARGSCSTPASGYVKDVVGSISSVTGNIVSCPTNIAIITSIKSTPMFALF